MLAYVFWHTLKPDVAAPTYEAALKAFHNVLNEAPPPGFRWSMVFRLPSAPWLPSTGVAYEDWYVLDNSASLDPLNDAAVSHARAAPHDTVAAMAAAGTAGLYRLRLGRPLRPPASVAWWFSRPDGLSYPRLFDSLREICTNGASLWGRQMTLGPTPEFCLHAPSAITLPYPARMVELTTLFTSSRRNPTAERP